MQNRYHSFYTVILAFLFVLISLDAQAQFSEPNIEKVDRSQRGWFMSEFGDIKWTGQGLYRDTEIDGMQTNKLRARLEARYGGPTQTIEDLITKNDFRMAEAIEFEYWFTVDDSIPMMVLDVDGPFGRGLVFGGASRYIDLMPQIKRTFAEKLMNDNMPAEFQDYYYSPERGKWFDVRYENGKYVSEEIESPEGLTTRF